MSSSDKLRTLPWLQHSYDTDGTAYGPPSMPYATAISPRLPRWAANRVHNMTRSPLLQLPREVLLMVYELLDHDTHMALRTTSRHWRRLSDSVVCRATGLESAGAARHFTNLMVQTFTPQPTVPVPGQVVHYVNPNRPDPAYPLRAMSHDERRALDTLLTVDTSQWYAAGRGHGPDLPEHSHHMRQSLAPLFERIVRVCVTNARAVVCDDVEVCDVCRFHHDTVYARRRHMPLPRPLLGYHLPDYKTPANVSAMLALPETLRARMGVYAVMPLPTDLMWYSHCFESSLEKSSASSVSSYHRQSKGSRTTALNLPLFLLDTDGTARITVPLLARFLAAQDAVVEDTRLSRVLCAHVRPGDGQLLTPFARSRCVCFPEDARIESLSFERASASNAYHGWGCRCCRCQQSHSTCPKEGVFLPSGIVHEYACTKCPQTYTWSRTDNLVSLVIESDHSVYTV